MPPGPVSEDYLELKFQNISDTLIEIKDVQSEISTIVSGISMNSAVLESDFKIHKSQNDRDHTRIYTKIKRVDDNNKARINKNYGMVEKSIIVLLSIILVTLTAFQVFGGG